MDGTVREHCLSARQIWVQILTSGQLAFLRLSFASYKEPGTDGDKWAGPQCVDRILEHPGSIPEKMAVITLGSYVYYEGSMRWVLSA